MAYIFNPTGGVTRNDANGLGYFNAPRGYHKHDGSDWTLPLGVGQIVTPAAEGIFERVSYPYKNTKEISGLRIRSEVLEIEMFYFEPDRSLLGTWLHAGQPIGIAQDCTAFYKNPKDGDLPHIHVGIIRCSQIILM